MSLIDVKAVEAEALKQLSDERAKKAKDTLVSQMRRVESAKDVLRAEELKLADLKAQIADGTL